MSTGDFKNKEMVKLNPSDKKPTEGGVCNGYNDKSSNTDFNPQYDHEQKYMMHEGP